MVFNNVGNWDFYLPVVLYSYPVKSHSFFNTSPYELTFDEPSLTAHDDLIKS